MHTLSFYPCSWCYAPSAFAHLHASIGGFILVVVLQGVISIWSPSAGGK